MRPVKARLCTYKELLDGTYTLNQLADFHEMLDEIEEYERRYEAARKDT